MKRRDEKGERKNGRRGRGRKMREYKVEVRRDGE